MQFDRESAIRIVRRPVDVEQMQEFLLGCVLISTDIETLPDMGLMNVIGFSGLHADGRIETYVVGFYLSKNPASGVDPVLAYALPAIVKILESDIPKTLQNGVYDAFWLVAYNIAINNYAFDTMTLWWSIFPELPKDLAFISSILLDDYVFWKGDRKSDSWHKYLIYNGLDCERTLRNTIVMINLLMAEGAENTRLNFLNAHARVMTSFAMSVKGLRIDRGNLQKHAVALERLAEEKLERLRYITADPEFNPNSPKQKVELFYTKLGAKPRTAKGRFVRKGDKPSAGKVPLRAIRGEHPIFRVMVDAVNDAIEPAKQISNVIKMPQHKSNRFYTAYNGVGTTTGRLSSSQTPMKTGGNAQNIRAAFRDWIQAEEDSILIDVDLSAADDVFVSFESGDPKKIELFRSGKDAHSENSVLFFPNWTYEEIVKGKGTHDPRITHPITGIRNITKRLCHGCNYLMAALTLLMSAGRDAIVAAALELGHSKAGSWSQDQLLDFCLSVENVYRNHYTRFKRHGEDSWYTDLKLEHRETGGFTSAYNYFQRFIGSNNDDGTLRAVAASAGQANTAGRINDIMLELDQGILRQEFRDAPAPFRNDEPLWINQREFGIDMRLQTHDSITFNANLKHPKVWEGIERVAKVMQRPSLIRNKLTGEIETFTVGVEAVVGTHWGNGMVEPKAFTAEAIEDLLIQGKVKLLP